MCSSVFSVLLLTFFTNVLATPTLLVLQQLEKRVAFGLQRDVCMTHRSSALLSVSTALAEARSCRYAGLPFPKYVSLRDKCKNRSELRAALNDCTSRCVVKNRELTAALMACQRIGWNGSGQRAKCPEIAPLRKQLAAIRQRKCPNEDLPPTSSLIATARETAEQRRVALGLPAPAYELTVLEPPGGLADSASIILHGFGQKVEQLIPVVRQVQTVFLPRTRIIIPQANEIFVDALGDRRNSWWNFQPGMAFSPAKADVLRAARNINAIANLQRRVHGIRPKRVSIFGVSQGGALAVTVYLRFKVGALVMQSTYLVLNETYPEELDQRSKGAPVLVLHGSADEAVPVEAGRNARDRLRSFGRTVRYVEYEGDDHTLTMSEQESAQETGRFIAGTLADSS